MTGLVSDAEELLQDLLPSSGGVAFDVGAHAGEWTKKAFSKRPTCSFHLFEPCPSTLDRLASEIAEASQGGNVVCNPVALGQRPGIGTLFEYPRRPDLNGLHRRTSVEAPLSLGRPNLREVPVTSIDAYCAGSGIRHVDFLKLDVEGHELAVLRGARRMLSRRDVAFVQIEYGGTYQDAGTRLEEVFEEVASHGYLMFKVTGSGPIRIPHFSPELEDYQYAIYLAATPRLRQHLLGGPLAMLDYDRLLQTYGVVPKGVIHVGAHEGQEFAEYANAGCREVVFIEADPDTCGRLKEKFAWTPSVRCIEQLISDKAGTVPFRRASMDQSSSMLPLKKHAELYPSITEVEVIARSAETLDAVLAREGIDVSAFNVLALDVQGAELHVLRGAAGQLGHVEAIVTEVNYDELYEGCARVHDIDDLLEPLGFVRVEETCPYHPSWGDALYIRPRRFSMSTLGRNGRFANQLFQYFFLDLAAHQLGGVVETQPWIGEDLFDLPGRRISGDYPQVVENVGRESLDSLLANVAPHRDADVWGYCQFHAASLAPHKERFRELFTPATELQEQLTHCMATIRAKGRSLVALHLRRGDYGYGRFFVAPSAWYLEALHAVWPTLDSPVLYVASDDLPAVLADFAAFDPICANDLPVALGEAQFYLDFYIQTQADVHAISNSSFSFAAAMLNARARIFLRPDPGAQALVSFDPWSSAPLLDPPTANRSANSGEVPVTAERPPLALSNES